jgi:hypothetical protein
VVSLFRDSAQALGKTLAALRADHPVGL